MTTSHILTCIHDTTQHRSILSGCCDPFFPSPDLFSEYVNSPNNDPDSIYIPLKVSNQHPSSTEDLQASIKPVGRKSGTTLGSIWVPCKASPKSFSTSPQQSPLGTLAPHPPLPWARVSRPQLHPPSPNWVDCQMQIILTTPPFHARWTAPAA